ncbi:MAG: hypothetical protein H0Z34_10260 [Brevibacillus sp.]|nr:hypothetical protein [Brevibacillus sp.]
MIAAKRLWRWHLAKEKLTKAEQALADLEAEEHRLRDAVARLEQKMREAPVSDEPEQQIARMLLEQELYMARRAWEDFLQWRVDREAVVHQEIQRHLWEKSQLEDDLDQQLLAAYERVAAIKRQPIVEVRNKSCTGCNLTLSLSKLAEWRRARELVYCDECGRILV